MANQPFSDYAWWVDYKGVWELRQAASLFLALDPDRGGDIIDVLNDLLANHEHGLILTDPETVWSVKTLKASGANVEWEDVLDKDGNSKVSLESFLRGRIKTGEIKSTSDDETGIYFKPIEITLFFQAHFLNSPPNDLIDALGINIAQKKKAQPISAIKLEREYKKYIKDCELQGSLPTWRDDKAAMQAALGKQITDSRIKNVRANLAPKSWQKRGRKASKTAF